MAICSIVSIRGTLLPVIISDIVEAGTPDILDTCRTDNCRFVIITSSNIFIMLIMAILQNFILKEKEILWDFWIFSESAELKVKILI